MKVEIKRNSTTRKIESADITGLTGENYVEIMLVLRLRVEYLEKSIDEYKSTDNTRLKEYIPKKEKEIEQVKRLINLMQ
ncbi:hypothetical protein psyc5s11_29290 [Clostridium gelidum]|uniref:Uncharacterized protein n=1 Tax=Clostridium gelidum TaxID=704125 RepID=A0ABM7T4M6_9CLOT|nr:hypothetical protein [Clostridium gelidum]BCZ46862.1 hypothetical protein psyc5s11_29290 [Clostridium gelidum]